MLTKVSPHVQIAGNLTAEGRRWCSVAPLVKAMDDPYPLTLARPGAATIFRAYVREEDMDGTSPQEFLNITVARLAGFRPTYIEAANEWRGLMRYGFAEHVAWLRVFVPLAHAAGYRVVGCNFPTGNIGEEECRLLRDNGFAGLDAIGQHEYWGSWGFTGWNALRYRRAHQWLGPGHPPIIITECGRDAVEGYERIEGVQEARPGWKLQNVSAEQYLAEWVDYDAELQQDPYVVGATGFTLASGEPRWERFALEDLAGRLADQTDTTAVPATPTQPGGTRPMGLREQYPAAFAEWEAAGGIENNFRKHLLGTQQLPASGADLKFLVNEVGASLAQVMGVLERLPL